MILAQDRKSRIDWTKAHSRNIRPKQFFREAT
jgi:hypothetical protein